MDLELLRRHTFGAVCENREMEKDLPSKLVAPSTYYPWYRKVWGESNLYLIAFASIASCVRCQLLQSSSVFSFGFSCLSLLGHDFWSILLYKLRHYWVISFPIMRTTTAGLLAPIVKMNVTQHMHTHAGMGWSICRYDHVLKIQKDFTR